ncbi:hypothetical protein [Krasilnikoviella flava]|uniref:Aromatic ring-opening dioxygenase LigA n=1 Tax=Krasilnikoviella flava TaxID=526729 RepID=A0A1T5JEM9_9MICO|nr:hypothetical protein [Krasilnikoviella flava]SKC49794.1 hypothetical protein SAMN04324258_1304 [Krasilnikoviella flava]
MSSTVTVHPTKGVRGIGLVTVIAGIVMIVAGLGVWVVVSQTLSAEEITVSEDASMFAGQHVAGPFTAYAQAEVINKHALEASDGQTYAQLAQDDPTRDTVMNASFLRASLFTSVVAFGVCALVIGLGIVFILLGSALRKLAGGPQVVVDTPGFTSSGDLSHAAHRADPDEPTSRPNTPAAPPPERPSTRTAPEAPSAGSSTPPSAPPSGPSSTAPENPPAAPPSGGSGSPSA